MATNARELDAAVVLAAIAQLNEQLETLKEQQEEIIEKLANLSLPGENYGIED